MVTCQVTADAVDLDSGDGGRKIGLFRFPFPGVTLGHAGPFQRKVPDSLHHRIQT